MLRKQNFSHAKRQKKVDFMGFLPTKQQKKKGKCHTAATIKPGGELPYIGYIGTCAAPLKNFLNHSFRLVQVTYSNEQ